MRNQQQQRKEREREREREKAKDKRITEKDMQGSVIKLGRV
jgi:hypothetical protein